MAILLEVKWVEQSNETEQHRRIRHIGGDSHQLRWKHSQVEAIGFIERKQFEYYIEKNPRSARLSVACTAGGKKYLTAQTDTETSQLLLDLPQFPGFDVNGHNLG